MKRGREWDGDSGPAKKVANEETRVRADESRRVTPPDRMSSPGPVPHRRSSSEPQREEQRRAAANESYHPSEAAHHLTTLPSIQQMEPHSSSSTSLAPLAVESAAPAANGSQTIRSPSQTHVKDESAQPPPAQEPAARKMDVDEDYDDDGADDEKKISSGSGSKDPSNAVSGNGSNSGPQ